jgi:hypothetical protein
MIWPIVAICVRSSSSKRSTGRAHEAQRRGAARGDLGVEALLLVLVELLGSGRLLGHRLRV